MFNGKFLSAPSTGVHRVASELITQIDGLLASRGRGADRSWSMVCPRDATRALPLANIARRQASLLTWQPWEQLELPIIARDAVLVNLCNLAPLYHPRSVTLIHDAQVFLTPQSYSAAFRVWYRFALPRIGANAARIVTISDYSREQLVGFGVAKREAMTVIPNGSDHLARVPSDGDDISRRLGLVPGRYVLALANAQAHKNVRVLLRAAPDLAALGLTLVLVGADGPAAFSSQGVDVDSRVRFAGRVTDGELRALYEDACCLAFPSTTEGFGLPPLEAMSLGCPAIVAPCGALPEVCGQAALYAAPDEPAAWVAILERLSRDDRLRAGLIAAGHVQAARFRWKDSAARLLDLIDSVA